MATNFVQDGDVIQFTPLTDTPANSVVVIGALLGVALVDIKAGMEGSTALEGVFICPKASAAVISQGDTLTWDVSAGEFDDSAATPAAGDVTGSCAVAFKAAGAGTTSVYVKFTGAPGTVH